MSIKIVEKNLLEASENVIGHQVNCQGVMGSGIAKQLREVYSNLYPSYKQYCSNHSPHELLGKCFIVKCGGKAVANLFGQLNFGRQNIRYTDYEALKESLIKLKRFAEDHAFSVALPYGIGCGLARGDWSEVYEMIEGVFKNYEVTLYKI